VVSGVVVRSGIAVSRFAFGYNTDSLFLLHIGLPSSNSAGRDVAERARILSGAIRSAAGVVDAASFVGVRPSSSTITSDEDGSGASFPLPADWLEVDDHFLGTLGIPLLAGRGFAPGDRMGGGAVVLDSIAATILFPRASPVGRSVRFGEADGTEQWFKVVGVVRNVQLRLPLDPDLRDGPRIYTSGVVSGQPRASDRVNLVVRARGALSHLERSVRRAIEGVQEGTADLQIEDWTGVDRARRASRILNRIFVTLAAIAALLASIGL